MWYSNTTAHQNPHIHPKKPRARQGKTSALLHTVTHAATYIATCCSTLQYRAHLKKPRVKGNHGSIKLNHTSCSKLLLTCPLQLPHIHAHAHAHAHALAHAHNYTQINTRMHAHTHARARPYSHKHITHISITRTRTHAHPPTSNVYICVPIDLELHPIGR